MRMAFRYPVVLLLVGIVFAAGCAMRPSLPHPDRTPPVSVEPPVSRKPVPKMGVPPLEQSVAGTRAFAWALHELGGIYPDAGLREALAGIGDRLGRQGAAGGHAIRVEIVNHSRPAAMVFPGGGIGLTRGLLQALGNESQVAAVIAHQMGHLQAGHLQRVWGRENLTPGLRALARLEKEKNLLSYYGAEVVAALEAAKALQEWEFTAEEERQADRSAVALLRGAGYQPLALPQAMKALDAGRKGGFPPPQPGLGWQFHPCSAEREKMGLELASVGGSLPRSTPFAEEGTAPWHRRLKEEAAGYLLYDQALEADRRNDSRAAVAGYLQAATTLPEDPLILGRLGLAYLREEDVGNARFYLEQALRLDPEHHASLLGLGFVHLAHGEFAAARRRLETAMGLLPTLQGAYLLAEACIGGGDLEKGKLLFGQVAEADSGGRFGLAAERRLQGLTGN
ncbi:MAG: M48 family metalloprotease [Desulfuromonadaceae bacterium]|nr:M48 family metalloprotease [Desulfuromonadaceae bacterium]